MMTETPVRLICLVRTNTSSCRAGESPADGSSSSRTEGSIISARPMATIWRSPPDSEPARCARRSAKAGNRPATNSNCFLNFFGDWKTPIWRFSSIVRLGKTLFVWGTNPTPLATSWFAFIPVMFSPRRVMDPLLTFTRPNMALSRVDLPAPFGPMMPTSSPSFT